MRGRGSQQVAQKLIVQTLNKVEQNFEQYTCPHVISRIRPDIADIKNTWMSVFFV